MAAQPPLVEQPQGELKSPAIPAQAGEYDPYAPRGPVIGSYKDRPIFDWLTECGRKVTFDRIAHVSVDGGIEASELGEGELMVPPGLVYKP